MTSTALKVVAPLTAPLPDGPVGNYYNETQWKTLMALMDTVIPSIKRESAGSTSTLDEELIPDTLYSTAVHQVQRVVPNSASEVQIDEFLAEKPSDNPEFHELVKRTLMQYSREDARKGFSFLLSGLK